jgi:hypothetical protein
MLRYDSLGQFLGRVGLGEYDMTHRAYFGRGDSLHVYSGARRVFVYRPTDARLARAYAPPRGQPVGISPEGVTYHEPYQFGFENPYFVNRLDGAGRVLDSFPLFSPRTGVKSTVRSGQRAWSGEQRVAVIPVVGHDGSFWTVTSAGDRLERHRPDGVPETLIGILRDPARRPLLTEVEAESLASLRRAGLMPRFSTAEEARRFATMPKQRTSMAVDSTGLIWLVRTVPAPSYDTIKVTLVDMSKTEAPEEIVIPRNIEDRRSHTIVEVIDPREHKLLARTTLPFLGILAAPGYVGRVTQNSDSSYATSLYPVRLRR